MKNIKIKKIFAILFLYIALTIIFSSCSNAVEKPSEKKQMDLSNMKLVFEDDFNGELDHTVWKTNFETPERRGGYWSDEQCFTQDGNLIIRTEYKEDGKYGSGWYTGTCLTQGLKEFTYGYFEVRCKAPAAEGLWSAFWMQADSMANNEFTKDGKDGAEIDIMESPYYNDPVNLPDVYRNTTLHTVHVNGYGDAHQSQNSNCYLVDKNMYSEFNTYGVLWTESKYVFYINGKETWSTDFGVSQAPEFLWLSVEIAGESGSANPENTDNKFAWSGDIRNNAEEIMPADFIVDYVRVYQ